jgi:glutamate 5-kinase
VKNSSKKKKQESGGMIQKHSDLPDATRIVVKVGSSSISGDRSHQMEGLVDALAACRKRGQEVILVSSGAIAIGMPYLELDNRPLDLATQQAAAAVGQNYLMGRYQDLFEHHAVTTAQVLLTLGDIENDVHRLNAQRTIERLLGLRVIPIVNENDTVATQEIRFGDNDRLAALVAELVGADALVLLSDVDALYTAPPSTPGAKRIDHVDVGDDLSWVELEVSAVNSVGTGGAITKVSAARLANEAGIPVLLAGTEHVGDALAGKKLGTWFSAALD